ncbi:MAG: glycosyltransferase [Prevotella sp.]|nr:glycosyltransferase [Prevotella sp.]
MSTINKAGNTDIKVSVVVPVYNVSAYVTACLTSVMDQTYQNIECILVDDCGTDDSMEICANLISAYQGDKEFVVIHHEKNRGLSAARNTGTAASTGDYVFYLDSDDMLYPDCIERMVNAVAKHPGVELVQGNMDSRPHRGYSLDKSLKKIEYVDEPYWMRLHFFHVPFLFPVTACNKLLKKEFLTRNELYFKEGLIHEDQLWMYQVALCVKKIAVIFDYTYIYILREGSIMATNVPSREAHHMGIILTDILNNLQEPYSDRAVLTYLPFFLLHYRINAANDVYENLYAKFQAQLRARKLTSISIGVSLFKAAPFTLLRRFIRRMIRYRIQFYLRCSVS